MELRLDHLLKHVSHGKRNYFIPKSSTFSRDSILLPVKKVSRKDSKLIPQRTEINASAALAFFPLRPLRELHLDTALLTQIERAQSSIAYLKL
jgi:hypothetical protein